MDIALDRLAPASLSRLPMPPFFAALPAPTADALRAVHTSATMRWSARRQRVRALLAAIPPEARRAAFRSSHFPPTPPPGWQQALPATVYNHLLAVHTNAQLSVAEKRARVDRIMATEVPTTIIERLPLPPHFQALDSSLQRRARLLLFDFRTPWETRRERIERFEKSLSGTQRLTMRAPLPPYFHMLPPQVCKRFLIKKSC